MDFFVPCFNNDLSNFKIIQIGKIIEQVKFSERFNKNDFLWKMLFMIKITVFNMFMNEKQNIMCSC